MAQVTVGVRELKAQFSHYLRRVAAGQTVVITDRGTPVGQIVPCAPSLEERLQQLVATGVVAWSGQRFSPSQPPVEKLAQDVMVSDLLLEDRE